MHGKTISNFLLSSVFLGFILGKTPVNIYKTFFNSDSSHFLAVISHDHLDSHSHLLSLPPHLSLILTAVLVAFANSSSFTHSPIMCSSQGSTSDPLPFSLSTISALNFIAKFYSHCPTVWWYVVRVLVAQSCPTLCDPVDHSPPDSSIHGILQARILEWVATSFSRGSSQPRDQTRVSCTAGKFFTDWATRELAYLTVTSNSTNPNYKPRCLYPFN